MNEWERRRDGSRERGSEGDKAREGERVGSGGDCGERRS